MKFALAILLLFAPVLGQETKKPDELKWIKIEEMSGPIAGHQGLTVEVSMSEIARRDTGVKLIIRFEYPWGSPPELFTKAPHGFDRTSITRVQGRIDFDCETQIAKPIKGQVELFQFNGRRYKFDEFGLSLPTAKMFRFYFCETQEVNTQSPPKLKPKPTP